MRNRPMILTASAALCASVALADFTVVPPDQYSWSENAGWMNWGDSPAGSEPVIMGTFMSGFVWWENAGWMNLGDGTPTNGVNYDNLTGGDFGVNYDPGTGDLFGLAWHENLGWINFDTFAAIGADRARYDVGSGRLRGYAWGENVGWVNLDDGTHFVAFSCVGDFTGDGVIDGADLAQLLASWGPCVGCPADLDGNGVVNGADLAQLLASWGAC